MTDELFGCVWPFCGVDAYRVILTRAMRFVCPNTLKARKIFAIWNFVADAILWQVFFNENGRWPLMKNYFYRKIFTHFLSFYIYLYYYIYILLLYIYNRVSKTVKTVKNTLKYDIYPQFSTLSTMFFTSTMIYCLRLLLCMVLLIFYWCDKFHAFIISGFGFWLNVFLFCSDIYTCTV